MMIVLSLRASWEVSMEGIVPDIERSRCIIGDDGGGKKARISACVVERVTR